MKNKLASMVATEVHEHEDIVDEKVAQRNRRLRSRVLLVVRFLPLLMFLAFLAFVVQPEQERVADEVTATTSRIGATADPLEQ